MISILWIAVAVVVLLVCVKLVRWVFPNATTGNILLITASITVILYGLKHGGW